MATRSSDVNVRLRLRGQRQFRREVIQAGADLEAMGLKGAAALGRFASKRDKLKNFGRQWSRNVTLPLVAGGAVAAKFATDWEDAFAGVEKTIDATPAQFRALDAGLRNMSMRIPVAATELAEIAEAAGQLGIERKAILGFTRTVADLGVATNLAGEEGASTLARFANITQMAQSDFGRLGSTIVALGNAGASTEKDIAAMGLRLAGAGAFVGMSEAQILGFANALSSVGIEAEAGGTSFSQVFKSLNSAVSTGGEELAAFADVAGVSGGEFAKAWKRDAATATVAWVEGLARLKREGKDVPAVLNELSPKLRGARVQDALLRASGAGKDLRDSLKLGIGAWKENNALTDEARKRYRTLKSQLQILKNIAVNFAVVIGRELVPAIRDFAEWAGPKVKILAAAFGGLTDSQKRMTIGAALLLGALGPLTWILGAVAGGVGNVLKFMKLLTGATWLWNASLLANPIVLIVVGIAALAAAFIVAYKKVGWFRDGVDAAFSWLKTAATDAAKWVVGAAEWIGRAFTNTKNWISGAVKNIVALWGKIKSSAAAVVTFLKGRFTDFIGFFRSLPGKISGAASGLFDGVKNAFRSAINWIIDKWNGLELRIGGQKISMPGPVPDIHIPNITLSTPDIPGLAAGGDVMRSGVVEVGERGPELLELPRAARVTPLDPRPMSVPSPRGGGASNRPLILNKLILPNGRVLAESVTDTAEGEAALGVAG